MVKSGLSGMKQYARRVALYGGPIASFLMFAVVLNTTNPLESSPITILIVFVLFYLLIASVFALTLHLIGVVVRMLLPTYAISFKKWYYVSSIVALAPVLFVALNTLGQFGGTEISLIVLFILLGSFYIVRRTDA